ncbi:hypothetical protein [Saccharopolyspora cebuensis]|uniref:Secreted protein n=1 Tax=Saccharopolyspora cebuensis TaxID=418759 RepID=A0ABV4CLE6_9PSEU
MQTWAKRGVQAALVTGGMLAAGTGVASADGTCPHGPSHPDHPTRPMDAVPPLPGGHEAARTCFTGELFPEAERGRHHLATPRHAAPARPVTTMTGTIDPVRDLLPEVENELTREIPVLRDLDAPEPVDPMRLAGWVAEEAAPAPQPRVGSPAAGFHRSLSWAGPIGEVIRGGAESLRTSAFPVGGQHVAAGLVTPADDPAHAADFGSTGIVDLWQGALGRGLLATEDVDLTETGLPEHRVDLVDVPRGLVGALLTAFGAEPVAARQDFVPLAVPGEHQVAVDEVPTLQGLPEGRGIEAPLPLVGELNGFSGGQTSLPVLNRITAALTGADARVAFSADPMSAPVEVVLLDELAAGMPEGKQVTTNPFREPAAPAPAPGGMALPVIDAVPVIEAVPTLTDETVRFDLTAVFADRGGAEDDTVVFARI